MLKIKQYSLPLALALALATHCGLTAEAKVPKTAKHGCQALTKFTWALDLKNGSLERLGKAEKPVSFCERAPSWGGSENLLLELREPGGRVVYSHKLFVALERNFETLNRDSGQLEGEARADSTPIITTFIPWEQAPVSHFARNLKLRFLLLSNKRVLAEGAP